MHLALLTLSALSLSPARQPTPNHAANSHAPATTTTAPRNRAPPLMQADQEREQERKSRTAVIQRPKAEPKQLRKEDVQNEPMWRLLIHNDDVHTWDYVIYAIVSTVRTITRTEAHRRATQVHAMGTAAVTATWEQQAKMYCMKLQEFGLTSSISPDTGGSDGAPGGGGG